MLIRKADWHPFSLSKKAAAAFLSDPAVLPRDGKVDRMVRKTAGYAAPFTGSGCKGIQGSS